MGMHGQCCGEAGKVAICGTTMRSRKRELNDFRLPTSFSNFLFLRFFRFNFYVRGEAKNWKLEANQKVEARSWKAKLEAVANSFSFHRPAKNNPFDKSTYFHRKPAFLAKLAAL